MAKPLNLEKANFNSKPTHQSTQIFLYIFLSTIFISFLYFANFQISLATLKDTKFWFFLSNIIIIIVAVDSGALYPSKQNTDLYEEYLKYSKSSNISGVASSPETCQKIDVKAGRDTSQDINENKKVLRRDTSQESVKENLCQFKYSPGNSEKRVADVDENMKVFRHWETEKVYRRTEESEFSAMSDEELNRRVEEFINRFNREIRLQEMRSE